jgi:hypothetical protein
MIRITPKQLKEVLKSIYEKPVSEMLSPSACTSIQQETESRMSISCFEPGKAFHTRLLEMKDSDTGGEEGTRYVIDTLDLNARVDRMKSAKTLTFESSRGVLTMSKDSKIIDGNSSSTGIVPLRQYGGELTDFPVFLKANELVAEVDAKMFSSWLSIKDFGEFTDKSEGSALTRLVLVNINNNQLEGLTNYLGAFMSYQNYRVDALTYDREIEICFEGSQLKKLASIIDQTNLSQSIKMYVQNINDEDWVTFEGPLGFSTLKTEVASERFVMDRQLFNESPKVIPYSKRGFKISDLEDAVYVMKPSAADSQELLLSEDTVLRISQAVVICDYNWSSADVIAEYSSGEWEPILLGAKTIESSLKSLVKYLKQVSATSDTIFCTQKYIQKKNSKWWILYFEPQFKTEGINIVNCMVCKSAEEFMGDLDTNE